MDETIRETSPGAAKRLETSIHDISPRKAGIASFKTISLKKRKRFYERISRHSRFSKTHPNQLDPVVSARFIRTCAIQSNHQDSPVSARLIESDGLPPTASSTSSHRPPQLATARGSQPGRAPIVESLFGLLRVRGVLIARAQSPFYDCSLVVLCPPVDF